MIADADNTGTVDAHDHATTDVEASDLHVAHADAGQTTSAAFTVREPGTYEVNSSVPATAKPA